MMSSLRLKTIIFFTFVASVAHSQQGDLLFQHLTLENGLSDPTNNYIYKDSKDFIWISSVNGLNRFDGNKIKVYRPSISDSTSIFGEIIQSNFFEDSLSNLWFSTYNGINFYFRKHDYFQHFTLTDENYNDVLGYHIFYFDLKHTLWLIVEGKGIYTFNILSKKFDYVLPLSKIFKRAIVIENGQNQIESIIVYRPNYTLIEEIELNGTTIKLDSKFKDVLQKLNVIPRKLVNDNNQFIWVAGINTLVKYNVQTGSFNNWDINGIVTIENKNDSILLVSIDGKGVMEFDKINLRFITQYFHEEGNSLSLLSNKISYISKDRHGGLWLSTTGQGLSFTDPHKRKFYSYTPILNNIANKTIFNPIGFFETPGGTIICPTTISGIYVLDRNGNNLLKWFPEDSSDNSRIYRIYNAFKDRSENLWLSTYRGLSVIPNRNYIRIDITDSTKIMWNAIQLSDNRLIFSSEPKGLFEIIPINSSYTIKPINPIRLNKEYLLIDQDKNLNIWMSEQLKSIIVLDPQTFNQVAEISISGIVSHLIEAKSTKSIWVSTSTGLYEVDSEKYSIKQVYEAWEKLGCTGFSNVVMDNNNNLWLTCGSKVLVFNLDTKQFHTYTETDGLPTTQFTRQAVKSFSDGEIWFGYQGGIIGFNPRKIHNIQTVASPHITTILINDAKPYKKLLCQETGATNVDEIQKLKFSYRENTLSFIINALEYSDPKNNRVQYKMAGMDDSWIEVPSGTLVRYPSMPNGEFSFQVKAANSDGEYNPLPKELKITIQPPYYKTWWFLMLTSFVVIGLVAYVVYLNLSKTIALQNIRLRLYENLHDDVGSKLTAIAGSAEDLIRSDSIINPKLESIAYASKNLVSNMKRLVWAIDPQNDSIESIISKIRHDNSLLFESKTNFHVNSSDLLKKVIVAGDIRYQLISIVNEGLNNISKYAMARNVNVNFSKESNWIYLSIYDDGIGFNVRELSESKITGSGYGLNNMQRRVKRLKGHINIQSEIGKGTRIDIRVPIK